MFVSNPQYQATTVKTLQDLVLIVATAMQRADTAANKSFSAVFAFVEDENAYYSFDPDSLVAPDVSLAFPYGQAIVFARSALQNDPTLSPSAPVVGDANKPGRWFVCGEVNQTLIADSPPLPAAPAPGIFLFPDLHIGSNRTNPGLAQCKVEFSCAWDAGPNGAAPGAALRFQVTLDGIPIAFAEAIESTTGIGQRGTASISAIIPLTEGRHAINVLADNVGGTAGSLVRAAPGHCNLSAEVLGA
jgi:hypothetical protein